MFDRSTIERHLLEMRQNQEQARAAFEQARGAAWYIENVLMSLLDDKSGEGDPESPPRPELVD